MTVAMRLRVAGRRVRRGAGLFCHDERGPLIVNRPRKALWRSRGWAAIALGLGCVPFGQGVLLLRHVDRLEPLAFYFGWLLLQVLFPALVLVGAVLRCCGLAETRLPDPDPCEDGRA